MKRRLLVAVLTLALGAAGVAGAPGASATTDFAGIATTTVADRGVVASGQCGFTAALTPNNRLQVAYGGTAESAAVGSVPALTAIGCQVSNQDQQSATSELANGGPAAATAGTAGPWRVSPVTICVRVIVIIVLPNGGIIIVDTGWICVTVTVCVNNICVDLKRPPAGVAKENVSWRRAS